MNWMNWINWVRHFSEHRNGGVGLPLFTAIAPGSIPLRVAAPGVAAGDEPHAVHLYGVEQAVGVTVDHAAIHFT